MNARDRINELCALKAGWLDGHGEAVELDPEYVAKVVKAIVEMHAGPAPVGIYPTPEGYIQLEWIEGKEMRTIVIES